LQRALSDAFDRIALANGYALAAIEGIPYFYRQFGYEFAIPLFDSLYTFQLDQIPLAPLSLFSFRPGQTADVPQLMAFYAQQGANLALTTERSEAMWHHYLSQPEGAPFSLRIFLILQDDQPTGYLALAPSGWVNRLNVVELTANSQEAILAALRFARAQADEGGHDSVGLQLPAGHPASEVARYMRIKEERTYGWQMKVLDPIGFLNTIAPALEERLAASVLRGLSGELSINLYRQKLVLCFEAGRAKAVAAEAEAEDDVRLPPPVATQLWLGWRSFPALDEWHKDVWAKEEVYHLLDVLFPPLSETRPAPAGAHIYLGY
jgi:predicted acetyltransferase